ncbi:MAG TPA: molecular chaperone TorD family protein, partial [Desulfobacteria bacterium]|nr:molecular chaperone TorD family protein [Desulfobacteria bacterium]
WQFFYSFMEDNKMAVSLDDLTIQERSLLLNGLPLLSQTFWGPSREWCEEIQLAKQTHELEKLGDMAEQDGAAHKMISYIDQISNLNRLCEILETAYVRLFISAKDGITASLHHSFYESEDGRLMGRSAKMMASRLKASGLAIQESGSVPADHLAVEVEYLTLLLEGAFGNGDENFLFSAKDFARSELGPWLTQFTKRLQAETECPFYCAAATLLLGLVTLISA